MVTRKNVNSLLPAERTELVDGLKSLKMSGRYDLYVARHGDATFSNIHQCPAFLPWHRQFILDLELELQTATGNPNFALPYWNWAEDVDMHPNPLDAPVWQNDLLGGQGNSANDFKVTSSHPLNGTDWPINEKPRSTSSAILMASDILIRQNGVGRANLSTGTDTTLPTQADISRVMRISEYDSSPYDTSSSPSFRNSLEGWIGPSPPELHNLGHVWVGGHMANSVSPNDPIFFLHHCFIDKIWADWQDANGINNYQPMSGARAGQNFNNNMEPTVSGNHRIRDLMDISTLNYSYDTSTTTTTPTPGGGNTCFIASAAFDSPFAKEVDELRHLRDTLLVHPKYHNISKGLVKQYYRFAPGVARSMKKNRALFYTIKYGVVYPSLYFLRHFFDKKNPES